MKNLTLLSIISFLLFACGGEEDKKYDTESTKYNIQYSHEKERFKHYDSYSVPNKQIEYEFYWNGSNYYPIGWSRDGNIAFRQFKSFDGIGGCLDEIIIQSMITDKTIKSIKLDEASGEDDNIDWNQHCNLEQTWRRERRTIVKYLNRYEIEDNSIGQIIKSKEIITNKGEYRIKLSQYTEREYENSGYNQTKYTLKVYLNGRSKTISKKVISAHNIDYLGYYKSPFEDRVVIVLQFQDAQEEEYSHNGGIITVGCDLNRKYWN